MGRLTTKIWHRPPTLNIKGGGGRGWKQDVARLRRLAASGKPVKLYRGEQNVLRQGWGLRTLHRVTKGQSWATSPHLAIEFARPRRSLGSQGLLYSITVPSSELKGLLSADPQPSRAYSRGILKPSGKWSYMTDPGMSPRAGKGVRLRLEIRPNVDRPDLKPKRVGLAYRHTNDHGPLYVFTRRLDRRRGGVPTRGGGA